MPTKVSLFAVMLLLAGCAVVLPGPSAGEVRMESEPNNGFDNATMLALGEACTGSVGSGADDVDYFGFNVTDQTLLTVTVTVTSTNQSGLTGVYNDSRKTVATGLGIAAGKSWTWQQNVGTHGGTWYLSVRGSETDYTVNLQGTTVVPDLPPVVVITSPENGSLAIEPYLEMTGTATDADGIREVWVYMVGDPPSKWLKAEGTTNWTAEVFIAEHPGYEGRVNITAQATDGAGNFATATITMRMNFRTRSGPGAPDANITEPADGTVFINREEITVRGTAYHPSGIRGVYCWINPGNGSYAFVNTSDGFRNWTSLVRLLPGESTISVYVKANDDNFSHAYTRVRLNTTSFTNDTTPPSVQISNVQNGTRVVQDEQSFELKGIAQDDHRVVYVMIEVNSAAKYYAYPATQTSRFDWAKKISLPDGDNVINVTAYDYSNNSASTTVTFDFKREDKEPFIPEAGAPALAAAYLLALCLLRRGKRST